MKKHLFAVVGIGACVAGLAGSAWGGAGAEPPKADKPAAKQPATAGAEDAAYVLGFKVVDIDGHEQDLSQYKGKVVMIVNVASKCGFTTQYEGLEKLYEAKKDQGLVILGFPANNFNKQEPGSDSEIKDFCTSTYGVSFPMFSKVSVKGEDKAPLYQKLAGQPAPIGGEPKWNFTKFLVDREGRVVYRTDAQREHVRTANLEPELVAKVDELLKTK